MPSHFRMKTRPFNRFAQRGAMAARLMIFVLLLGLSMAGGAVTEPGKLKDRPGDDLFVNGVVPRLCIEIPPEGIAILRAYEWNRKLNGQDRTNVLAMVRDGNKVYTNVAIHLKGGLGSFRPLDDKPALTLNFERSAEGQRFHGLQKVHLNNSVQDSSY